MSYMYLLIVLFILNLTVFRYLIIKCIPIVTSLAFLFPQVFLLKFINGNLLDCTCMKLNLSHQIPLFTLIPKLCLECLIPRQRKKLVIKMNLGCNVKKCTVISHDEVKHYKQWRILARFRKIIRAA